ncbi:MAG: hypothetical protein QM808_08105 [Steroidobacteraceae bacterium]
MFKRSIRCLSAMTALVVPVSVLAAPPDLSGTWTIDGPRGLFKSVGENYQTEQLSLTPKYKEEHAAIIKQRGPSGGGNMANCTPPGMPGMMNHGMMFEVLVTANRVTLLFEDGEVRRLYTDGRAHPAEEELLPSFTGHSIAHWESDTLVVDTVGMREEAELFLAGGQRVTANTQIVERIGLNQAGEMEIATEVIDPAIFTTPYRYSRIYVKAGVEMYEAGCSFANRDSESAVNLKPPVVEPLPNKTTSKKDRP